MTSLTWSVLALALTFAGAAAQQNLSNADSHLAAAQIAERNQDYATAEREYRAAIALMPDYAEVHMNLGLTYQMQGRIPEAMEELGRATKINPKLAGANLMLGIDYCKLGQGGEAIHYLAAAVALDQNRIEGYSWLATAQEISGDYQAELLTIERALKLQPENVDLLYLEGHTYGLLGREQALAMNAAESDLSLSERLLAESYAMSAEWPSAVIHFRNALAASPHRGGLHVELGEVLLRVGKLDQARQEFEDELRIDPANVRAAVRRGEAELLDGDPDRGLADWSHAVGTDSIYAYHLLGVDGAAPGMIMADALPAATLETLTSLEPRLLHYNTPVSRLALAYIARLQGKDAGLPEAALLKSLHSEGARPACTGAGVRRAAENGRVSDAAECGRHVLPAGISEDLRIVVAASLLELGEYELSLKTLSGSRRPAPRGAEVDYLRARCFEELSTASYLRLYRSDRNSFRVHQLMGDLAAARDDDKKAIEEYRAAIALKPLTPNLHYSLAHVLWKNSDIANARAEFDAELAITPTHTGVLHDLGQTYLMEHQPEKALRFLNQAVAAGARGPDLDRDLGTAYEQLGQYRNAEAKYTLALPGDHDGSIHFKLARVYRALGEKEKATHESAVAADLNRKYHTKLEEQTPRLKAIDE